MAAGLATAYASPSSSSALGSGSFLRTSQMVKQPTKVPPTCAPNAVPPPPGLKCSDNNSAPKSWRNQKQITIHAASQNSPWKNRNQNQKNQRKLIFVLAIRMRKPPMQAEIAPDAPTIG